MSLQKPMTGAKDNILTLSNIKIDRLGASNRHWRELYAKSLTAKWRYLFLILLIIYVIANLCFGFLFWILPHGVVGADTYWQSVFFSVQTMSTIGYGHMYPDSIIAHLIVAFQSLIGLVTLAAVTGVVFAKFAKPAAGIIFSHRAVITPYHGQNALMFRLANKRGSEVISAEIDVIVLIREVSPEGIEMWKQTSLRLVREKSSFIAISWTIIHVIDEKSPLYGLNLSDLESGDIRIIATLTGHDGTFSNTIYLSHTYYYDDIFYGAQLVDFLTTVSKGHIVMDLNKIHDVYYPKKQEY